MAVAFGTSSSVTEATAVNCTYTAPASIANGDLLMIWHIMFLAGGTPPTPTPPAGFSQVPGITWPINVAGFTAADHITCWLWYKIAASESGNYTVTHTSSVRRGWMARITGANTTTPFAPNPTSNAGVAPTGNLPITSTFLGLTTSVDSELIMAIGTDWNDSANNLTPPAGSTPTFTERVDIGGAYLATGLLSPAGATGNKTMTNNSGVNNPWATVLAAVQPSGGAAPGRGKSRSRLYVPSRSAAISEARLN